MVHTTPRFGCYGLFLLLLATSTTQLPAKPGKRKTPAKQLTFSRWVNVNSAIQFNYTNRGVLFNNDQSGGLFWPRGTKDEYIFAEGLWVAAKKRVNGSLQKLCTVGYNPNSGVSWFKEGETPGTTPFDGADSSKFFSYNSRSFDHVTGKPLPSLPIAPTPSYYWPIWGEAGKVGKNYNFGRYVPDVHMRETMSHDGHSVPVFISDEDIISVYSDADSAQNPEFHTGVGYPFRITVVESTYGWKSGPLRDVVFVKEQVVNGSSDTLVDVCLAPAFDPDLGTVGGSGGMGQNDKNRAITDADSDLTKTVLAGTPYAVHPSKLNMGYQFSEHSGGEYGMIAFALMQTPIVSAAGLPIDAADSMGRHGFGATSLPEIGLRTFRTWSINNDPLPAQRYDFVADGTITIAVGAQGDKRVIFSTGPFTLLPGAGAEMMYAMGLAHPSVTDRQANFDSLLRLVAHAHALFADTSGSYAETHDPNATIIHHFKQQPNAGVAMNGAARAIRAVRSYPNPFTQSTLIGFSLDARSTVTVELFDMLGRHISTALNSTLEAGDHTVSFDGSKMPSGTYTAKVSIAGESQEIKLVVTR